MDIYLKEDLERGAGIVNKSTDLQSVVGECEGHIGTEVQMHPYSLGV